jgi:single-strand DNA-binding protein
MINKAILIGNVGKDPEIRTVGDNKVANFSLATSETYKDKSGNKQTNTDWHSITIWGKLADVVERYVKKGDRLYLEGKISYRSYDDKEGVKRYVTDIVCNSMTMLGGKQEEKHEYQAPTVETAGDEAGNDLPF